MIFRRGEADLIRDARKGDGAAFAEVIRPHYDAAFRLAYGLLHDTGEAEDAVQDAAFKAWRRLGNPGRAQASGRGSWASWRTSAAT